MISNWKELSLLIMVLGAFLVCQTFCFDQQQDLLMTYEKFRVKYDKENIDSDEYLKRQLIFYNNMEQFKRDITQGCPYCGVTKFFDLTKDEFRSMLALQTLNSTQNTSDSSNQAVQVVVASTTSDNVANLKVSNTTAAPPTQLNWKDKGKITSVKNQGKCGTCWSFATAAMSQSSLILKGEAFNIFSYQPDLSQQFLLTCTSGSTCNGGYLQDAIDLAVQKGLPYQSKYPYVAKKTSSSICSSTSSNVKISNGSRQSYYNINDSKIIELLQNGPVAIALSADNWEKYASRTFSCPLNPSINHAVLLVGYDKNRWIIKNQWGTNWGQDGYMYITRNRTKNCKIGSAVHTLNELRIRPNILIGFLLATVIFLIFN